MSAVDTDTGGDTRISLSADYRVLCPMTTLEIGRCYGVVRSCVRDLLSVCPIIYDDTYPGKQGRVLILLEFHDPFFLLLHDLEEQIRFPFAIAPLLTMRYVERILDVFFRGIIWLSISQDGLK